MKKSQYKYLSCAILFKCNIYIQISVILLQIYFWIKWKHQRFCYSGSWKYYWINIVHTVYIHHVRLCQVAKVWIPVSHLWGNTWSIISPIMFRFLNWIRNSWHLCLFGHHTAGFCGCQSFCIRSWTRATL